MAGLTKLALLGAFLSVSGVLCMVVSWRHRGEWEEVMEQDGTIDYSNMMLGIIGFFGLLVGICALVPPIVATLDGGPWR